jgi:hypothetical protein
VFDWPTDGRLHLAGLRSEIAVARLLAAPNDGALAVRRLNRDDHEIRVPARPPDPWDSVIVLDAAGNIDVNPARLIAARSLTSLHVFHGTLHGQEIRYGDGKRLRDSTLGWNGADSGVDWRVRLVQPARFRVRINYATSENTDTGSFQIRLADRVLKGTVRPTERADAFATVDVGEVALDAGEFAISIRPAAINGRELMRLRTIELAPVVARVGQPRPQ